MSKFSQQVKAERFRALHHSDHMLVLPNIWDPLGAALLEDLAYPAIATASASVAFSNGYDDGENIPFDNVLARLVQIVKQVDLPVTADIESGYASNLKQLTENIYQLLETGIVGINLEDFDKATNKLFSIEDQCERITTVRQAAQSKSIQLFINARTDVYLRGSSNQSTEAKLDETIKRGKAYLEAGADCIFPPAMTDTNDLAGLVKTLNCPVNVLAVSGIPDLKSLQNIGIARLSLGPGFLKVAIKAMKDVAIKLKTLEGIEQVVNNPVSSQYLKGLVEKPAQ